MATATMKVIVIKGSNLTAPITVGESLRFLGDGEEAPANHHVFRILTEGDGDKRIVWDPSSFTEMREAKELFDRCIREGLVPYICKQDGSVSTDVMDLFDPGAGEVVFREVVMVPQRLAMGG